MLVIPLGCLLGERTEKTGKINVSPIVLIMSVAPDTFSGILPSDSKRLIGDRERLSENYYENCITDGVSSNGKCNNTDSYLVSSS
jgi:hypothetical protein